MFYWTANNDSSYLNGVREAWSLRSAVIAARRYVNAELLGEGVVTIWEGSVNGRPFRVDERSIHTNYKWTTRS